MLLDLHECKCTLNKKKCQAHHIHVLHIWKGISQLRHKYLLRLILRQKNIIFNINKPGTVFPIFFTILLLLQSSQSSISLNMLDITLMAFDAYFDLLRVKIEC